MKLERIILAILVICLITAGASQTVLAAESNANSTGTAEFIVDTDPTDPLNPDEGGGDGGEGTGNPGPLSIDYVPTLNFGNELVLPSGLVSGVYPALISPADIANLPRIQVTDKRGGSTGWSVTATAGFFTYKDDENEINNHQITGAQIKFEAGVLTANTSTAPEPANTGAFTLECNGTSSTPVMSAERDTGMGTWVNRYYPLTNNKVSTDITTNEKITLVVPPNTARALQYQCTIDWTLNDTP